MTTSGCASGYACSYPHSAVGIDDTWELDDHATFISIWPTPEELKELIKEAVREVLDERGHATTTVAIPPEEFDEWQKRM